MAPFFGSFFAEPLAQTSQTSRNFQALPQQLTTLTSSLRLRDRRSTRTSRAFPAVAGVAIPLPGVSRMSAAQVGRTLLRTTSSGLSDSADMLKRTLSGKVVDESEAVQQVLTLHNNAFLCQSDCSSNSITCWTF